MHKNRFYDQDPLVSKAVSLLLMLPGEVQTLTATYLSRIAEAEYRAHEMMQDTKTLGSDKILALYKSKQKKRDFDQNPAIHRALNYLMLLSEQHRQLIAHRLVGLIFHLQEYLKSCRMFSILPTRDQMNDVCNAYLKLGPEEASRMIKMIETESQRDAWRYPGNFPAIPPQVESILEKHVGLHIRTRKQPNAKPQDT
jgi:hypothetical protein